MREAGKVYHCLEFGRTRDSKLRYLIISKSLIVNTPQIALCFGTVLEYGGCGGVDCGLAASRLANDDPALE